MKADRTSILFGVTISTLVAGTLVIAGLKAGITPGVSPLVILFAWGGFSALTQGEAGRRFLNIAQVAGSAGMAVTGGVIFVAPMIQILHTFQGLEPPPVDVASLTVLSLAGALIGFGFVGLATKKFLSDPTLPAPEARACEAMIETAAADAAARPRLGPSLYAGLVVSFLSPLLVNVGAAVSKIKLFAGTQPGGSRSYDVSIPFMPIYIGIGGLLTLSTALLVFGGSFLRLIGDVAVASVPAGSALEANFPDNSMRWVGGAAMTVAVAYSLVKFFGKGAAAQAAAHPSDGGDVDDAGLLEIDPGMRRFLALSIVAGVGILVGWLLIKDGPSAFTWSMTGVLLVLAMVMVTLGAILSLQIGSSASPVSGTIFVTTLVLCLVALALGRDQISDVMLLTPLLTGACVAVCTANDSSQDYKTLQLCGVRVQDGFVAQLLGLLAACVVVPFVLFVADNAYTLGSDALPAPQGKMFATLATGLLLESDLPLQPILVGLVIGAAAVAMDFAASKRGLQLPSMALAVGIYLPPYLGIGILIGALFRRIGEGRRETPRHEALLAAAGMITGAALLELILGIVILLNEDFDPDSSLRLFSADGADPSAFAIPAGVPLAVSVVGILAFGWILFRNARDPVRD